jgi:hypothetical protein
MEEERMKVFISMKVPHGDSNLEQLAMLTAEIVRQAGHDPFTATEEILNQGLSNPKEFMPFAKYHVETSSLVIVLYHPELRGGLIELGLAYANDIPIWLCHKPGQRISSSALGCAEKTIEYTSLEDLRSTLSTHMRKLKPSS